MAVVEVGIHTAQDDPAAFSLLILRVAGTSCFFFPVATAIKLGLPVRSILQPRVLAIVHSSANASRFKLFPKPFV